MAKVKMMIMDREERAYDRGQMDAYYGRPMDPNIWLDKLGKIVVTEDRMSDAEKGSYYDGYMDQEERKDWGDDDDG